MDKQELKDLRTAADYSGMTKFKRAVELLEDMVKLVEELQNERR